MPPPALTAGPSFVVPPVLIDLTQSDDEDSIPVQPAQNELPPSHATFLPEYISISNHGLILPGASFRVGRGSNGDSNNRALPRRQSRFSRQAGLRSSKLPTTNHFPQLYNGSDSENKRPTGDQITRSIFKQDVYNLAPPNPAKRRKTENAPILRPSLDSAPILPPQKHSSLYSSLGTKTPHAIRSSETRSQTRKPQPKRQEEVRKQRQQNHIRTEFDRRKSSRKSQFPPSKNFDNISPENDKRLHDIAENLILKHVRAAIQEYCSSLIRDTQDKIAFDAAAKLLSDPSLYENFQTNTWTADYEKELAVKAASYVNSIAVDILQHQKVQLQVSEETKSKGDDSVNLEISYKRPSTSTNRAGHCEGRRSTSGSSTEEEAVFEDSAQSKLTVPSHTWIQRHYSSSPTTSYSTDLPDGIALTDPDRLGSSSASRAVDLTISAKSPRTSRHHRPNVYYKQKKTRSATVVSKDQYVCPPGPKLAIIREFQSLRLASLDDKLKRPYISFTDREDIRRGLEILRDDEKQHFLAAQLRQLENSVLHVDFCPEEMEFICMIIRAVKGGNPPAGVGITRQIITLMKGQRSNIEQICSIVKAAIQKPGEETAWSLLRIRDEKAIRSFLEDAAAGNLATTPQFIRLESESISKRPPPGPTISFLLRERETWGMAPFRVDHCNQPFEVEFSNHLEDSLALQSQWTDCCGDISTLTWTSNQAFICGATAHSDYHNMQYNKPGNLTVGSAPLDTLKSIPDHKIVRPIIGCSENAENALESMRQTQDPWLYTSVVSTAHSDVSGFSFTASFDETVKVWKVTPDGSSMNLCGTWQHDGKVNFVVTSQNHERVATASDVSSRAIRVYNFDESSISDSPYDTYDCDKAMAQAQAPHRREKWAYFPATIAWGKSLSVEMFLLVGYSPRSLTSNENEIPEDKVNSGELCLWNVKNGEQILITSAKSQNVFEVIWHPTQPMFLAATSPCGVYDPETRTQIRLFAQSENGTFSHIKALDCRASDINELTVMPNSSIQCYVTASCTDGNCYVWDTAQGDRPIHILGHGDSLDNPIHDIPREDADTGVKFAAWGRTVGRIYTGSSDGKVKAWDIQAPRSEAFLRTVLTLSGGISVGSFSKDFSKLIIGDATGKVHLLGINDEEVEDEDENEIVSERAIGNRSVGRNLRGFAASLPVQAANKIPKVIIPHSEPAPPTGFEIRSVVEQSARDMARAFLEEGQLMLHSDRMIGAVQGPNYAETLFYRFEAHEDNDGTKPLQPDWQVRQQCEIQRQFSNLTLSRLPKITASNSVQHAKNTNLDFDFSRLSLETKQELERDRVDLRFDNEHTFDYEISPRKKIFRRHKEHRQQSAL